MTVATQMRLKYRLLAGSHVQNDANGKEDMFRAYPARSREYPRGLQPIIESSVDLCRRFNKPGFPKKFERVPQSTPTSLPDKLVREEEETEEEFFEETVAPSMDQVIASIDNMTVEQLKAFADEEEIDLSTAKTKAEIVKVIKSTTASLLT